MKQARSKEGLSTHLARIWRGFKDFLYGFFMYGMVQEVVGRKIERERLFLLFTLGDFLGMPVFPGYYKLRLLPYCLPGLERWQRSSSRPKDMFTHLKE